MLGIKQEVNGTLASCCAMLVSIFFFFVFVNTVVSAQPDWSLDALKSGAISVQQIPYNQTGNFITYESVSSPYTASLGIKIQYPSDWNVHDSGDLVMFEAPCCWSPSIGAYAQTGTSADSWYSTTFTVRLVEVKPDNLLLDWGNNANFTIMPTIVNDIPGIKIEHNLTTLSGPPVEGGSLQAYGSMDIYVWKIDKLYSIEYRAPSGYYAHFMPQVQKMIDSIIFVR